MLQTSDNPPCWFAGHETFTLRHGWLPKAIRHSRDDQHLFTQENALITLGVGKNMVRSIRHWALATCVLEEGAMAKGTRTRPVKATVLGDMLFGENGMDAYLEDPATLWLLHWEMASRRDGPTAWWWVFNEFPENEFTRERLHAALEQFVDRSDFKRVAPSSLNADVNCLIRTYLAPRGHRAAVLEDTLDCPLTELSLLHELDDGVLVFNRGEHPSLPSAVVAYAVLDHWERTAKHKKTMTFDQLAYQPGGPGRVFKLSENALTDHLEAMQRLTKNNITYDVTAGLRQMYWREDVDKESLLRRHYMDARG